MCEGLLLLCMTLYEPHSTHYGPGSRGSMRVRMSSQVLLTGWNSSAVVSVGNPGVCPVDIYSLIAVAVAHRACTV